MNREEIRDFCLSLKGVSEDLKWENDLCFLIGKKMFCVCNVNPEFGFSFKVRPEEFEELCELADVKSAPYLGRYKWVYVSAPEALSRADWKHYVSQSYELVKAKLPAKIRREIEG